MQQDCPFCRNPVEVTGDQNVEVHCTACGGSFRLEQERTRTLQQERSLLGKFELLEQIGVGASGAVWRARDTELDRLVAIKIPHAGRLTTEAEEERFLHEGRTTARLRHPGIVSVHEVGHDGRLPYIVTDLIEGMTLADVLTARRPSFTQAAALVAEVAGALDHAHAMGIVHRDVKPSNIMMERGAPGAASSGAAARAALGKPMLMDFGIALRSDPETTVASTGQVLGTPAYMSPEQAAGLSEVDSRSDVYSLGVVLYQLLTGELPFRGNTRMLIDQVLREEPQPPRRLNDKIPRDLETITIKAMAKEPGRRYQTARAMAEDLRRSLRGEPIHARPVGKTERLWLWCRRNPAAAALLVAVSLGSSTGFWHLSRLSGYLVREAALESASMQAEIMETINALYSSEVVDRVRPLDVHVTHNYEGEQGAIPLPATFTIELGERLVSNQMGMQVRLYSDYPFRSRRDGGPKDPFEHEALRRLRQDPARGFSRFEEFKGRHSLRYARARLMQESCVACHNSHPDSTKTDWKMGDVRGVLEIIRPLDRDISRIRTGLRGTFALVAVVSMGLLGVCVGAIMVQKRRRSRRGVELGS